MTTARRLGTAVVATTILLSGAGCGVGPGGPRIPVRDTTAPLTPLASVVVRGDADPVEGTVDAGRARALVRAVRTTRLATAPVFTGTCPTAHDGSETVLRWSPDPSLDDVEVSSCERVLSADDPLVAAMGELLVEVRPDAP